MAVDSSPELTAATEWSWRCSRRFRRSASRRDAGTSKSWTREASLDPVPPCHAAVKPATSVGWVPSTNSSTSCCRCFRCSGFEWTAEILSKARFAAAAAVAVAVDI